MKSSTYFDLRFFNEKEYLSKLQLNLNFFVLSYLFLRIKLDIYVSLLENIVWIFQKYSNLIWYEFNIKIPTRFKSSSFNLQNILTILMIFSMSFNSRWVWLFFFLLVIYKCLWIVWIFPNIKFPKIKILVRSVFRLNKINT
jgi:hypothetical protein